MSYIGRRLVPQSTIDRRVQAKDDRVNRATQRRMALAAAALLLKPAPELEAHEDDDDREELSGFTCGASCGYCGRCS